MKFMTGIFSNPDAIMTEIAWQRRSIPCRFDWSSSRDV